MEEFTMSMYKSKEDFYKAKSECLEKKLRELKAAWDAGWFCSDDDNLKRFELLMSEI